MPPLPLDGGLGLGYTTVVVAEIRICELGLVVVVGRGWASVEEGRSDATRFETEILDEGKEEETMNDEGVTTEETLLVVALELGVTIGAPPVLVVLVGATGTLDGTGLPQACEITESQFLAVSILMTTEPQGSVPIMFPVQPHLDLHF